MSRNDQLERMRKVRGYDVAITVMDLKGEKYTHEYRMITSGGTRHILTGIIHTIQSIVEDIPNIRNKDILNIMVTSVE